VKAFVDEDICSGCGVCVEICPDVFALDEEAGLAKVKANPVPVSAELSCRSAKEQCPVEAIIIENY